MKTEKKKKSGREVIPAVRNGNNSGAILSDFKKHGHGEIEMGTRRVTPTTIVIW